MKKLFLSILVLCSLLGGNAYANSFTINENDKFGCSSSGGSYLITILKKYDDNYFVIQKKLRGKYVNFASFSSSSLEFLWFDEKGFLTAETLMQENDKYSNFMFLVNPTKEQKPSFGSKKSKFNNKRIGEIQTLDLSEDELKNEIEVHNFKLSIIGEILASEENIEKQGVDTVTVYCRKR